jgi:hypothetical protein
MLLFPALVPTMLVPNDDRVNRVVEFYRLQTSRPGDLESMTMTLAAMRKRRVRGNN